VYGDTVLRVLLEGVPNKFQPLANQIGRRGCPILKREVLKMAKY
jgi:hypothetical protein